MKLKKYVVEIVCSLLFLSGLLWAIVVIKDKHIIFVSGVYTVALLALIWKRR